MRLNCCDSSKAWWRDAIFSKLDIPLRGIDETLKYAAVFDNAVKILVNAGELYPPFYNNPTIIEKFKKAATKRRADIKILFGPALYVDSVDFIKFALEYDNVKLYKRDIRDETHFKLIYHWDGNEFAILDEPHAMNVKTKKRRSYLLTSDYQDLIGTLNREFEKKLEVSGEIDKNKIVELFRKTSGTGSDLRGFVCIENDEPVLATPEQIDKFQSILFNH